MTRHSGNELHLLRQLRSLSGLPKTWGTTRASHRLSVGRQSLRPQHFAFGTASQVSARHEGWFVWLEASPPRSRSDPRRGLIDYASLWQAGFRNVTYAMGTHLNGRQLRQQCDRPRTVHMAFDADTNGSSQSASQSLACRLREQGLNVRIVWLPDGHDPNSFSFRVAGRARENTRSTDRSLRWSSQEPSQPPLSFSAANCFILCDRYFGMCMTIPKHFLIAFCSRYIYGFGLFVSSLFFVTRRQIANLDG